jgi:hypothetical protein
LIAQKTTNRQRDAKNPIHAARYRVAPATPANTDAKNQTIEKSTGVIQLVSGSLLIKPGRILTAPGARREFAPDAPSSSGQTDDTCRPVRGHGDTNHEHSGPPGQNQDAGSGSNGKPHR